MIENKATKAFGRIRSNKAAKTVLTSVWWIAVLLLVILLVTVVGAKIRGEVPSVFGYSVLNIVTGSMEPEISPGDYILVKRTDPRELSVGDVITFYSRDPLIQGLPNTHRIVEEPQMTEDGLVFTTRGDANSANDRHKVYETDIVGVYVKKLGGLGRLSDALEKGGIMFLIILIQLGLLAMVAYSSVGKIREALKEASEEKEGTTRVEKTGELTDRDGSREALEEEIARQAVSDYLSSKNKNMKGGPKENE